jgi:preprotein translocase subunit SecE
MIAKIQKFFSEVVAELKKVSWTSRQELIDATRLVIVSSFFLGIFIGATDFVLSRFLTILIR